MNLYYTPPSDAEFDELKQAAIGIWRVMGYEPSYSLEKIGRIKDIKNIADNFMYIVAMFDLTNQQILANKINPATRQSVRDRLIAGGTDPHFLTF